MKYRGHPQYNFWISDHLLKVGIPDCRLLNHIRGVINFIHATYASNLRKKEIKILDLGCGMGEFAVSLSLSGYNVVTVDADREP